MSSTASDSDDEGFAPFIPGAVAAPTPQQPAQGDDDVTLSSQRMKRPREPSGADDDGSEGGGNAQRTPTATPPPKLAGEAEAAHGASSPISAEGREPMDEESVAAWGRYVSLGLPCASLYYRSFQHTSEPTPHCETERQDDEASAPLGDHSGGSGTAAAVSDAAATSYTVDDMLTIQDSLGVLVCSIDEYGVLRLWRKLPRGVFFWGELDRIFGAVSGPPRPTSSHHQGGGLGGTDSRGDDGRAASGDRRFYLRSCGEVPSLVCVCVQQVWDAPVSAAVEVHVEVRVVNPYTLTVEGRRQFVFVAPLSDDAARQPCYAPQPYLLIHKYELFVAMFTALVPSSDDSAPSSAGSLAQGVVIVACQGDKTTHAESHASAAVSEATSAAHAAAAVQYVEPAPLSVASRVVGCAQASVSSRAHKDQQKLPLPCVLLGADGMVDYAIMEPAPVESGGARGEASLFRRSEWCLRVIGGLATCPPRSADQRVWSQMISFKRRAGTDFYALLRLARTEAGDESAPSALGMYGHELAADVVPLGVRFVAGGDAFVVASARVSLCSTAAAATGTAKTDLAVCIQPAVHWFDFASGKLCGTYVTPLDGTSEALTTVPLHCPGVDAEGAVRLWRTWRRQLITSGRVGEGCVPQVGLHVLPSASPTVPGGFEFHILVPELAPAELLPGLLVLSSSSSTAHGGRKPTAAVPGRLVRVYRASLATTAGGTPQANGTATVRQLSIAPLAHTIGESEKLVRRGLWPRTAEGGGRCGGSGSTGGLEETAVLMGPSATAASSASTARGAASVPLLLVSTAVAPTQSLRNFITQSPVGAALTAEEVKHLLVVPSRSEASSPVDGTQSHTDALVCTTSLGPETASALILYSNTAAELNPTTAAAAQWLSKLRTAQEGTAPHESTCAQAEADVLAQQRAWQTVLLELAQRREFACGDLLAGTTTTNTAPAPSATTGVPATTPTDAEAETGADVEAEGGGTALALGAVAPTAQTASSAVSPVLDERGKVLALLAPVLAALPPASSVSSASSYVMKEHGLVHVRGYGTVRLSFLPRLAPLAVENFQRLARQGYYNGLLFHRVIPLTIVQGGCPNGDGTGGRCIFDGQESFQDENLDVFPFFSHTEHVWLCMANAGANTNGSQFFFTVPGAQDMPWLNGHHTVFGFVVGGASLLTAISEVPRDENDKPRIPVVMERIDIY